MHVDEQRIQTCTPGIAQGATATNLGFGNLYYALVRTLRPKHVLVIGSGYGFSPAVMGLALADNGAGALTFVDPSMDRSREGLNAAHGGTGQWDTPERVVARFSCAGVPPGIVTHYKETNQQFFAKYAYRSLPAIDLALIDGAHDEANASFDLAAVVDQLSLPGYVLMHDATHFLNRTPFMGVTQVIERARAKGGVEEVTFPGDAGLALLRFTSRPQIEIRRVPPPSVFWPVFGVFAAGIALGVGGTMLIQYTRRRRNPIITATLLGVAANHVL